MRKTIECPNCNGTGYWSSRLAFWTCMSCEACWTEISIQRILRPNAARAGACFVPDPDGKEFDYYRGYAVHAIGPRGSEERLANARISESVRSW